MLVETFEETEVNADLEIENEAEAIALIEQLSLEGQQKLLTPDNPDQRIPYRKMKADEKFVYELLCPKKTRLDKYEDSPIPVRVLQVASHAASMFDELWIWSAEDADIKDPVLVGIQGTQFQGQRFILARWGAELEDLSVLMQRACEIHHRKVLAAFEQGKAKIESGLQAARNTTGLAVRELTAPVVHV